MRQVSRLALALVFTLVWTARADACSCVVTTPTEARDAATWVFEGVLVWSEPSNEPERQRARFRVERVWKGTIPHEVVIDTPSAGSMCPPHLAVGERYILYVGGTAEAPRVASCARYAHGGELAAERRALGPSTAVHQPPTRAR